MRILTGFTRAIRRLMRFGKRPFVAMGFVLGSDKRSSDGSVAQSQSESHEESDEAENEFDDDDDSDDNLNSTDDVKERYLETWSIRNLMRIRTLRYTWKLTNFWTPTIIVMASNWRIQTSTLNRVKMTKQTIKPGLKTFEKRRQR